MLATTPSFSGRLVKAVRIQTWCAISGAHCRREQELYRVDLCDEYKESHLHGAVMLYTSNAIDPELNEVLRSEDRGKIKKFFPYLRLLLEALGRLPQQNKELYRGVSVDLFDEYKEKSTVTWWGVSSCTSDINVANGFMKGCGGKCTLLKVRSKTAADISSITFFGNEKEHLLAPGTQLKVVSRKKEGKVTEIVVEEVGRVLD
mmetsp:Transcript_71823/g.134312  ORF Transcript_71823/g.134312 Transcript_71823/m.134312 type:complete len:203 (-) Transcript_71823:89-697(-)